MSKGYTNQVHPPDWIDGQPIVSSGREFNGQWRPNVITINNGEMEMNEKSQPNITDGYVARERTAKYPPVKEVSSKHPPTQAVNHGCYFRDGVRRIDYIMVYNQSEKSNHKSTINETRRKYFLQNLQNDGIELETEEIEEEGETLVFIKVHSPFDALCQIADHLKLEMPLKIHDHPVKLKHHQLAEVWSKFFNCYYCTRIGKQTYSPDETVIYYPFDAKDIDLFDIKDENTFFSNMQRNEIVYEILQQIPNHPQDPKLRGIEGLVEHGIFESAYPVHENFGTDFNDKRAEVPETLRHELRRTWSNWMNVFSVQPVHKIRSYFGEKIGFYFVFMDFYTKQLVIPTVIGLIIFIAGMTTAWRDSEIEDICDEHTAPGKYWMCPICKPPNCEPWKMFEEGCHKYKWEYALDNEGTIAVSCLVMLWAILFLKFWKRHESRFASEWNTINFKIHDATIRPEYEERAPTTRKNPITLKVEPHIPIHLRILWTSLSIFATFSILAIAGLALAGLVVSRVALYGAFKQAPGALGHHNIDFSRWFVHFLIFILVTISEKIYNMIVLKLTSLECPRTHHEFMTSLLWKFFVFEIINECVPIFYAAFLKGKTVATPIQLDATTELCDGGCMGEVVELVFVLLTLRLFIGNVMELGLPVIKNCIKRCQNKNLGKPSTMPQWLQDFYLNEVELDGVYEDYMEMMVQFAFVVLFIPAFPLAPLLCLVNNIIEIRLDATKMLILNRRPLPVRVPGIQIWNKFLDIIVKFGIIVNAALIAFTSDVIPRLYYQYNRNEIYREENVTALRHHNHKGFTLYSLSFVNVTDWEHYHHHLEEEFDELAEKYHEHHIERCYYMGYRSEVGPDYPHKPDFWRIAAVRLITFAIYSCCFFIIMWLINGIISDEPGRIEIKTARQIHSAKKHLNEERRKMTKVGSRDGTDGIARRASAYIPIDKDDNVSIHNP